MNDYVPLIAIDIILFLLIFDYAAAVI